MRVLVYLLMIVVSTALTLGAALLIALQLHDAPNGLLLAAAFTSPFLVMGPVFVGAFAGYFDHRASRDGRRYLGWWLLGVVVVDLVAAVVIVLATLSAGAPVWVPVVLLGGAAVLLAVARPLGALFRRTEPPIEASPDPAVPDADAIRHKVVVIGITFVIAAVVATIGVSLLAALAPVRGKDLLQMVMLGGQLTFTATAMAAIVVTLPMSRALRDVGGRDVGRLRRFAKVVLRGKPAALDRAEERGALQYARLVPLSLQFQLVYVALLYTAFAFQFVSQIVVGRLGVLPDVILAMLVVVLAVTVPQTIRRIRRARRYVAEHRAALDGATTPSLSGA